MLSGSPDSASARQHAAELLAAAAAERGAVGGPTPARTAGADVRTRTRTRRTLLAGHPALDPAAPPARPDPPRTRPTAPPLRRSDAGWHKRRTRTATTRRRDPTLPAMELTPAETRVLGCLLEKQLATPNVYPLTLNAIVAAANQSSNRDPVVNYSEAEVAGALAGLRDEGAARIVYGSGQRAEKYRHVLDEVWGLDEQHRAVLCVLMLRGPQTVGELRARTDRLARFDSLGEVEQVLRLLASREEPLARRLERAPGPEGGPLGRIVQRGVGRPRCRRPGRGGRTARTTATAPAPQSPAGDQLRADVAALRTRSTSSGPRWRACGPSSRTSAPCSTDAAPAGDDLPGRRDAPEWRANPWGTLVGVRDTQAGQLGGIPHR